MPTRFLHFQQWIFLRMNKVCQRLQRCENFALVTNSITTTISSCPSGGCYGEAPLYSRMSITLCSLHAFSCYQFARSCLQSSANWLSLSSAGINNYAATDFGFIFGRWGPWFTHPVGWWPGCVVSHKRFSDSNFLLAFLFQFCFTQFRFLIGRFVWLQSK